MRRKLQIRLDPDTDIIIREISGESGESQARAINQIIRDYAKEKREAEDLRAAVAAGRAAEAQGRIIEEILNSMILGFAALGEKQYQPEEIHPIVSGAKAAEAQRRLDRMKRKSV